MKIHKHQFNKTFLFFLCSCQIEMKLFNKINFTIFLSFQLIDKKYKWYKLILKFQEHVTRAMTGQTFTHCHQIIIHHDNIIGTIDTASQYNPLLLIMKFINRHTGVIITFNPLKSLQIQNNNQEYLKFKPTHIHTNIDKNRAWTGSCSSCIDSLTSITSCIRVLKVADGQVWGSYSTTRILSIA